MQKLKPLLNESDVICFQFSCSLNNFPLLHPTARDNFDDEVSLRLLETHL